MEEQKYQIGDFIKCQIGSSSSICYVLDANLSKDTKWKYEADKLSGAIIKVVQEKVIAKATGDEQQKWIAERIKLLESPQKVAELAQNFIKREANREEVGLEEVLSALLNGVPSEKHEELEKNVREALRVETLRDASVLRQREDGDKIIIGLNPVVAILQAQDSNPRVLPPEYETAITPPKEKRQAKTKVETKSKTQPVHSGQTEDVSAVVFNKLSHDDEPSAADAEPTPKEIAEGLGDRWNSLPPDASEQARKELAEEIRQHLDTPLETSEANKEITQFFDLCNAEPEKPHPLFWILSGRASPQQRRHLIAQLDLKILEKYVEWLESRKTPNSFPVPISQTQGLMDDLTNRLSQAFQAATHEGGVNHYQRIAQTMMRLLTLLDDEARGPYEWRLFSFLREGWARTAPHAQAGNNDLTGARAYLNWVLDQKERELLPKTIWPSLLISLMDDSALDRLGADTRQGVLEYAAAYALNAEAEQKKSRLLHFQTGLSVKTMIEFMTAVSKEADKNK